MARDVEYLTWNRRSRYPFSDDSKLPCPDGDSIYVFGCFIDAMVQVKSHEFSGAVKVKGISLSGHTLSFTLSGTSDIQITCTRSSVRFPVITGECSWCWYTFVMSSDGLREYEDHLTSIGSISGSSLLLSDRCVGVPAGSVSSLMIYGGTASDASGKRLKLYDALSSTPDDVVSEEFILETGNNVRFDEDADGFSINAVPGAGKGKIVCSGSDDYESYFKTPGLKTADGHVRLFNDTCYDIVPTVYSKSSGELGIHVKCKACCTCEMYEKIVNEKLVPLKDEILDDKDVFYSTFDKYEENVEKWNKRLKKALPEDIVVTVSGVALDAAGTDLSGASKVRGRMDRCGFSSVVRNDSFVDVTMVLDGISANGDVFESQISYMKDDKTPVVTHIGTGGGTFVLNPGRSANVTFYVRRTSLVTTDHQTGFIGTISFSAYADGKLIVKKTERLSI